MLRARAGARRGGGRRRPARLADLRRSPGGRDARIVELPHGLYHVAADGRLHLGRLRRGDLRRGGGRVPRAPDHDGRARPPRSAARLLGPPQRASPRRRVSRTGATASASAWPASSRRAMSGGQSLGPVRNRHFACSERETMARGDMTVVIARADEAARLRRCALSSPAGPGSSARTSCAGAAHDVVVLDRLTYSGNPANLDGRPARVPPRRHRRRRGRREPPAAGCEAVVNFAAETHVDRSILDPREFVHTDVFGTQTLLEWAASSGARYVQVSTDEVYGDLEAGGRSREDDPAPALEPVLGGQGRGRPAGARLRPHLRGERLDHARAPTPTARTSTRRR